MPEPIVIVEYDPEWPEQFESIRARVSDAMGPLAVTIEHVGTTAVPGLAAKPIIDLDIVVRSLSDVPLGIHLLASIGYAHEGDLDITGREAFSIPQGMYRHHPYLVTIDGREFRRHMALRDRFRVDSDARSEYEELKRRLAREHGSDSDSYTNAKSEFVERILAEGLGPDH